MIYNNNNMKLSSIFAIALILCSCWFTIPRSVSASEKGENDFVEVVKVNGPNNDWEPYPNPEERKLAKAAGCSNGEVGYFDGCNRCSCPKPMKPTWCTYRLCLRPKEKPLRKRNN